MSHLESNELFGKISFLKIGTLLVAAFVALTLIFGSFYTIDQGERGVVLRNGGFIGVSDPGLNFKMPIFDKFVPIDVRNNVRTFTDLAAYSKDQQTAIMRVSVNYSVPADRVADVYNTYGSIEAMLMRVLDPQVFDELKTVFGQFNAVTAIQDRARLSADIQSAIRGAVVGPLLITNIQIENIDFSDVYENSIEDRMLAEVEVQRVRQNAEREKITAEITVIQAQAEADSSLARARADAEATRLRGEAEAFAISARGEALRDSPNLVELTKAERWNGVLPTSMIPGTAVPFLDVSPDL
jgi:regulator of protease activity HflC (stomatin/prohibitin superfamily)